MTNREHEHGCFAIEVAVVSSYGCFRMLIYLYQPFHFLTLYWHICSAHRERVDPRCMVYEGLISAMLILSALTNMLEAGPKTSPVFRIAVLVHAAAIRTS